MAEEKKVASEKGGLFKKKIPVKLIATAVIALFIGFGLSAALGCNITGAFVSKQDAGDKVISYMNTNILPRYGANAELVSIEEMGNSLYSVNMLIKGKGGSQPTSVFVTKDGNYLLPVSEQYLVDLNEEPEQPAQEQPETIPKTDKPEVHAFVMSYCPFGLQFMKAYIPVIELLRDKADLELNFVHYIMHGEKEIHENNRIYCIQKEQQDKLTKYIRCFVASDNSEDCIAEVGVNEEKLESCISSIDKQFNITGLYNDRSTWSRDVYPQYPVDAELASKYGIGGSPTFIINGKTLNVNRSPEAIKEAVCSAFNNPPKECSQKLSANIEAPGIGPISVGSGSSNPSGGCQ